MKRKIIILSLCLSLCLVGCNDTNKKDDNNENIKTSISGENDEKVIALSNGIIIEYFSAPVSGTKEDMDNYFSIKLDSEQNLEYGYTSGEEKENIVLTEEEYQEIIDLVSSEKFNKLDTDLTDTRISDGERAHITVHYSDGTNKTFGGINPTNKTFCELRDLLLEYADK